jgi:hypothetical protein
MQTFVSKTTGTHRSSNTTVHGIELLNANEQLQASDDGTLV